MLQRAIILLMILISVGCIDILKVGPGLPKADMMAPWYIPGLHPSGEENFAVVGNGFSPVKFYNDKQYPLFSPEFGRKASDQAYAVYEKNESIYIVASYYFENEKRGVEEVETLVHRLKKVGKIIDSTENFSVKLLPNDAEYSNITLNITRFETADEIGYIFIYHRPFLDAREEAFFVYYGAKKDSKDVEKTWDDLPLLIRESYYMSNKEGEVTGM